MERQGRRQREEGIQKGTGLAVSWLNMRAGTLLQGRRRRGASSVDDLHVVAVDLCLSHEFLVMNDVSCHFPAMAQNDATASFDSTQPYHSLVAAKERGGWEHAETAIVCFACERNRRLVCGKPVCSETPNTSFCCHRQHDDKH